MALACEERPAGIAIFGLGSVVRIPLCPAFGLRNGTAHRSGRNDRGPGRTSVQAQDPVPDIPRLHKLDSPVPISPRRAD